MSNPSQRESGKSVTDDDARIMWVSRATTDHPNGAIVGVFRHPEGAVDQDFPDNDHHADPVPLFEDDPDVLAFLRGDRSEPHVIEDGPHEHQPPPPPPAIPDSPPVPDAVAPVDAGGGSGDSSAGVDGLGAETAEPIEALTSTDSPGIMLTVDQRRAELADGLTAEYQNRIAPIAEKRREANTRIVTLSNQNERSDEEVDELKVLHDRVRDYDALTDTLTAHLVSMQGALLRRPADDLLSFDPAFGWPT